MVVDTGGSVVAASWWGEDLLLKAETPCGMEDCIGPVCEVDWEQTGIGGVLDGRTGEDNCDSVVVDIAGGAIVWVEGAVVDAEKACCKETTCWDCRILVGHSRASSTEAV